MTTEVKGEDDALLHKDEENKGGIMTRVSRALSKSLVFTINKMYWIHKPNLLYVYKYMYYNI